MYNIESKRFDAAIIIHNERKRGLNDDPIVLLPTDRIIDVVPFIVPMIADRTKCDRIMKYECGCPVILIHQCPYTTLW